MKRFQPGFSIHTSISWFGALVIADHGLRFCQLSGLTGSLSFAVPVKKPQTWPLCLREHIDGTFSQIENTLFALRNARESGVSDDEMQGTLHSFVASRPDLFNLLSIIDAEGNVRVTDKPVFTPTYSGDRHFFVYHRDHAWRTMRAKLLHWAG